MLVLAGLSDMARPADKLSLTQNAALMATGAIWTRWCLIIKPRNVLLVLPLRLLLNSLYAFLSHVSISCMIKKKKKKKVLTTLSCRLATVNFFVGCVGLTQVVRIFLYRRSLDGSTREALKDMGHEASDSTKKMVEKAEEAVHHKKH